MAARSAIRAVIFDLGGVLYPFRDYAKFKAMCQKAFDESVKDALDGWHDGRLATSEMREVFEQTFGALPKNASDLEEVRLTDFMGPKLKKRKVKVGLLTNNGWWTPERRNSVIVDDLSPFDVVVESCREGVSKPDPKIFEIVLQRLDLKPEECVFVDDTKKNVDSAARLGIKGVQMVDQDEDLAVERLQKLLGVS